MKKNAMMRIASIVLVLTLLSTCAISGTFAKYVTTVSGGDNARTAVWDITADFGEADGDGDMLFKASYNGTNNQITVEASNKKAADEGNAAVHGDNLVAPGTNDEYTYGLTGAPEVDYVVSFALDSDPTDVTLKVGTYTFDGPYKDMTVTPSEDYLPLKWKVTISTTNGTLTDSAASGFTAGTAREFASLAAIKTALSTVNVAFDANETCDVAVKIEWEWAFINSIDGADKMDTVLGYYAKNAEDSNFTLPFTATGEGAGAVTIVSYDFSMTATQVD